MLRTLVRDLGRALCALVRARTRGLTSERSERPHEAAQRPTSLLTILRASGFPKGFPGPSKTAGGCVSWHGCTRIARSKWRAAQDLNRNGSQPAQMVMPVRMFSNGHQFGVLDASESPGDRDSSVFGSVGA